MPLIHYLGLNTGKQTYLDCGRDNWNNVGWAESRKWDPYFLCSYRDMNPSCGPTLVNAYPFLSILLLLKGQRRV